MPLSESVLCQVNAPNPAEPLPRRRFGLIGRLPEAFIISLSAFNL